MNIVILTSGGLGYDVTSKLFNELTVIGLATDSSSEEIIGLAKEYGIPLFEGNPRNGKLRGFLEQLSEEVNLILSVNYLFLLEKDVIEYPSRFCLNIHGSLLPKYRGRTPHVWAIINNESYAGITLHIIDEGCDTGPIVAQHKIVISPEMTGGELLEQYYYHYPDLIRQTIKKISQEQIIPIPQDESKATYFGKRTPEDGEINWDWHRERIRNWVRAQADPYPGAFTFVGDNKITIDKVTYSDYGFNSQVPNGTVLSVSPKVVVKTPNGALALTHIRDDIDKDKQLKGKVLG